jgi:hypothetical protein
MRGWDDGGDERVAVGGRQNDAKSDRKPWTRMERRGERRVSTCNNNGAPLSHESTHVATAGLRSTRNARFLARMRPRSSLSLLVVGAARGKKKADSAALVHRRPAERYRGMCSRRRCMQESMPVTRVQCRPYLMQMGVIANRKAEDDAQHSREFTVVRMSVTSVEP